MLDFLLNLHSFFYGLNDRKRYKGKNYLMFLICNVGARLFKIIVYYWVRLKYKFGIISKPSGKPQKDLVVSFTSFPARIDKVWMVVDSIMRQTVVPEKFILYLSKLNFPNKTNDLPASLLKYEKIGLEIKFVKEDLRPHKKYLYAFREYTDKCVVTIDDDIYYRKDLLQHLWNLHEHFPTCVVANIGRQIYSDRLYNQWDFNSIQRQTPRHDVIAIGCGGILYPVKLFDMGMVDDVESIVECSLGTDDLWLKVMELKCDIPIVIGSYYCTPPSLPDSFTTSLSKENYKFASANDSNWKKLVDKYNINIVRGSK